MGTTLKLLPWLYRSKTNAEGKTPIYLRLTLNNQRIEIATGHFIRQNDWNSRTHSMKKTAPQAVLINESLQVLQAQISRLYSQLSLNGKPFTLAVIKNKITGKEARKTSLMQAIHYHNDLVKKGIGKNYAQGTYKAYQWFSDKIQSFLQYQYNRKDILLQELNHKFLTEFEHYLYHVLHNQVNTAQKNIVQLRKIVWICIDLEWLDKMPFKKIKRRAYTPQRDYLSEDELSRLENLEITNKRLLTIRDKFIFQCYTGISYVDLNNLTSRNLVKGIDGEDWIILYRQKTKARSTIPLLPRAKKLIALYRDPKRDTIFPTCSNQKYNMYLKELMRICGISKRVTTHSGRRTFATTVTLSNGVPIETVSRMLGHSDLKTTAIYAKVVDTKVSEDMSKIKFKLERKTG